MTDEQLDHFDRWLYSVVGDDFSYWCKVRNSMLQLLWNYPELVEDHSWSEIRSIAKRRKYEPTSFEKGRS